MVAHPSWFVFDLGNVLLNLDYERVLATIATRAERAPEEIGEILEGPGGYRDLERGAVSFGDFHRLLISKAGYHADLSTLRAAWSDFFDGTVPGMPELLEQVRKWYGVAFLSNSNEVHAEIIPESFPQLFRDGDPLILSHLVKSAKPDPLIFEAALSRLQASASDCVFIDDLSENVKAAVAQGFIAFRFIDRRQLARELRQAGLLPPRRMP